MTAPDRIWVGYRGVNIEKADRDDVEYLRRAPEVLAVDATVQAMVAAAENRWIERAARVADGYGPCACDPEMRDAIRALKGAKP